MNVVLEECKSCQPNCCAGARRVSVAGSRRRQGAPAGCVVIGRLCGGRHDIADRRRGAMRGDGVAPRQQGARCRGRQRQCDTGGSAPVVRGHLDRLRSGAARTRPRTRHGRTAGHRCSGSRCRGATVPRQQLRCGGLDLWRHVHAGPGQGGGRDAPRPANRGGKIGLANWTPDGFIGAVFKTLGSHVAPPAG